jgi:hypothetical protein
MLNPDAEVCSACERRYLDERPGPPRGERAADALERLDPEDLGLTSVLED